MTASIDSQILQGPAAAPASGQPARQLIILLHGVGADGNDLFGLVPHLQPVFPDAAFLSPDAPQAYDMAPFGRQWFSIREYNDAAIRAGVAATAPILHDFIDEQRDQRGLAEDQVALIGFSQGTMMSLYVGLRREASLAGIVGFSGRWIEDEPPIIARPPVLLIHGEADPVLPFANLARAEAALEAAEVAVESLARPHLGHGIDGPGLHAAVHFLNRVLTTS